ncbi:hypothetical protein ABPG74_011453 [Tetrahymena malaccensis]
MNQRLIQYIDDNKRQCEIRPSNQQLQIILSDKFEDQKIVACAGSGKTTTIILRIKYLIENGVEPQNILVLMFNRSASHNFQKKSNFILKLNAEKIKICTLDKFAYDVYYSKISNYNIDQIAQPNVREYGQKLLQYLKTPLGTQEVLSKYKYVFFDEFQDANDTQYNTLMLFKKNGSFISVFGDDSQSIYGWRGSNINFIQSQIDQDVLAESQKEIKTYYLSTNYRSTKSIVQFSNQILKQCDNLLQKEVNWANQQNVADKLPTLQIYFSQMQQLNSIIQIIQKVRKDFYLNEIAVLCPTNRPLDILEGLLVKNNQESYNQEIPFIKKQDTLYKLSNQQQIEDKLTLSTFHTSKGLEWKVVFIIGLNDAYFPGSFQPNQKCKLEESKRMFYVACTRAKQILQFSAVKFSKDQKNYICRFFNEIDKTCYQMQDQIDKDDFAGSNKKIKEKDHELNRITDLIKSFSPLDYDQVSQYTDGVKEIPNEHNLIHEKTGFAYRNIKKEKLECELGLYVDILAQRYIQEKFEKKDQYEYEYANYIMYTIFWGDKLYDAFKKYEMILRNIPQFDNIIDGQTFIQKIVQIQNTSPLLFTQLHNLKQDENILIQIFSVIKNFIQKKNIKFSQTYHRKKNEDDGYFPEDFKEIQKFEKSYQKFCCKENKTFDIQKDIYITSIMKQIYDQKIKFLYKDYFSLLNPNNLNQNICQFLEYLESFEYQTIISKKVCCDEKKLIQGEIDILADDTIYEIKCSAFKDLQKDWLFQCLAYAALMRSNNHQIKYFVIYNPICGEIKKFDITNWGHDTQFIQFLYQVKEKNQKLSTTNLCTQIQQSTQDTDTDTDQDTYTDTESLSLFSTDSQNDEECQINPFCLENSQNNENNLNSKRKRFESSQLVFNLEEYNYEPQIAKNQYTMQQN